MDVESGLRERKKKVTENPPANDCCPICFGDFTFPCRTNCNHWFCANCILEYWHYGVALKPCKCPLCSNNINTLTPEASLHHSQELKAAEALKNIQQYNRLFVGGTHGLLLLLLGLLFYLCGCVSHPRLFECYALSVFLIIHLVGRYRRRRLLQRVRQLAAPHP